MIGGLRKSLPALGMFQVLPRRFERGFATINQESHGHGDHKESKSGYFIILGVAAIGCGAISLLKYAYKDKNFVDISVSYSLRFFRESERLIMVGCQNNMKKRMYDDRASKNYPVKAWPNIEYALTVLYGFDVMSHLALALNSLKFVSKSLNDESPAELIGEANELEAHVKAVLSVFISYLIEKASLSNGAQVAIDSLRGASQSDGHIKWAIIDDEFSDVDWINEKPPASFLSPEIKEKFIARTKRLSYEANILERKVEKYLTGKI